MIQKKTAPRKISTGVDVTESEFRRRLRTNLQQKVGSCVPGNAHLDGQARCGREVPGR